MQGGVDSGFLPNPNNTISPPPTYMFQVKDMTPSCKLDLNHSETLCLSNAEADIDPRVLLQTEETSRALRSGHDLQHQPDSRQNPSHVHANGHATEWYRRGYNEYGR